MSVIPQGALSDKFHVGGRKNDGLPKLLRSQSSALGQILELRPDNTRMDFLLSSGKRSKPTVAASHDVFFTAYTGKPDQTLGDKLGMLDQRGGVGDDAGN